MASSALLRQSNIRFRNDDGDELGATWSHALNANYGLMQPGTMFRIRIGVEEYGGKTARALTFALMYRRNSGAWTLVSSDATPIFSAYDSSFIGPTDRTTQQITSGSYQAGQMIEAGTTVDPITLAANTSFEHELVLVMNLDAYNATYFEGDLIELALGGSDGSLLDDYLVTPDINVAPLTKFSKLYLGSQQITEFYLGGNIVPQIFLGSQEVYRNT